MWPDQELNQQPLSAWDEAQPTGPHGPEGIWHLNETNGQIYFNNFMREWFPPQRTVFMSHIVTQNYFKSTISSLFPLSSIFSAPPNPPIWPLKLSPQQSNRILLESGGGGMVRGNHGDIHSWAGSDILTPKILNYKSKSKFVSFFFAKVEQQAIL